MRRESRDRSRDRGGFDELRPGADDGQDSPFGHPLALRNSGKNRACCSMQRADGRRGWRGSSRSCAANPSRSGVCGAEIQLLAGLLGRAEAFAGAVPFAGAERGRSGVGLPVSSLTRSARSRIEVSTPEARL